MIQLLILILGGTAIALIASKSERLQLFGFIAGVLSEPLWIYEAYNAGHWGICVLAVWWGIFYFIGMMRRL